MWRLNSSKLSFGIVIEIVELSCWLIGITCLVWIALNEISESKSPRPMLNHPPTIAGR